MRLITVIKRSHHNRGVWWFRFGNWGPGLHIKDTTKAPILFSERSGLRKILRIGKWSIRYLKPVRKDVLEVFSESYKRKK